MKDNTVLLILVLVLVLAGKTSAAEQISGAANDGAPQLEVITDDNGRVIGLRRGPIEIRARTRGWTIEPDAQNLDGLENADTIVRDCYGVIELRRHASGTDITGWTGKKDAQE